MLFRCCSSCQNEPRKKNIFLSPSVRWNSQKQLVQNVKMSFNLQLKTEYLIIDVDFNSKHTSYQHTLTNRNRITLYNTMRPFQELFSQWLLEYLMVFVKYSYIDNSVLHRHSDYNDLALLLSVFPSIYLVAFTKFASTSSLAFRPNLIPIFLLISLLPLANLSWGPKFILSQHYYC